ncbi:MAG: hypothetical protein LGR52_09435, partial [Candidatus Thiosymbion ectosymbiont of Robbea hypermnestra]|nr:hypothetical protein [Candidatus Thiosymbion ectosymbiont of Robbea hypermnestra]
MTPAELALATIRRTLREIARQGDGERLRRLLRGQELPALGGGEEPAERIIQALELPPYDVDLTHRIGRLCADSARLWLKRAEEQLMWETQQLAVAGGTTCTVPSTAIPELEDEPYIYNLLLLTSWLPRDAELFAALYPYHTDGFALSVLVAGSSRSAWQLRRALCNQQTDDRLKDYWLSLLRGSEAGSPWDAARRSELLEAWRGILWLPRPSASGPPLDLAAMDEGLYLLEGTVARRVEGLTIMRNALRRMVDAIPLDPATWVELIRPFWSDWPELLKDVAAEIWPALEPSPLAALPQLPKELAELWEAFDEDTRSAIREALNRDDAEAGRRLLNDLAFSPPQMVGLPPQERRRRILDLEHRLWPSAKAQPPVETLHDGRGRRKKPKPAKAKTTKRIDRQAALEAINRGLASVEQCLRCGDEAKARRFLDGLVKNQAAQGLPDTPVHIAKTLSKAAALAQNAGYLEWAERLQREACRHNREDPVAASGLADVLKARGELEAAEQQYRDSMAR